MRQISTTPFGQRPVTAGLLATQALLARGEAVEKHDKWALLRDLTDARAAFGVSDRDLTVLAALLSFNQGEALDGEFLVVFPSNAALSQRAHGMAESTLRRHLAALAGAGLILRHDSPNGKRYAARGASGEIEVAFGFDLRPLSLRGAEIHAAALAAREAELRRKRLREALVVTLRDAGKYLDYALETGAADLDELFEELAGLRRVLRRKLTTDELAALLSKAREVLARVTGLLDHSGTTNMDGNDVHSERHYQNSKADSHDSEPCKEQQGRDLPDTLDQPQVTRLLPVYLVLKACPEIETYAQKPVRTWADLIAAARFVRPMLGISPDAWSEAEAAMGLESAAVTLAAILQNGAKIGSPGGYLRALAAKAGQGAFSPGPMVMALLRGENERSI